MVALRKVLQPKYMKDFNCIGSACEDSCCIGWQVHIDKHTYHDYKNVRDNDLKVLMKSAIKRNKQAKTDHAYGRIVMENSGRCPFLNRENLCDIYIKMGEKHMSDTCKTYPRTMNRIDEVLEQSATISCPEIARMVLLNPDGIAFEHIEKSLPTKVSIRRALNTRIEGEEGLQECFWDIRLFSLALLQNRDYGIGDRLVLLGIAYKRIEQYASDNKLEQISDMLNQLSNDIEMGVFDDQLKDIPVNNELQFKLAKELTEQRNMKGIHISSYQEYVKDVLVGLKFAESNSYENVVNRYNMCHDKYYMDYINEKEHVLENFLVNEYFRRIMPFGFYDTIWDSYVFLCFMYGMAKMHLIGLSGCYEGLTDELVVSFMQSFAKVTIHNSRYLSRMIALLKDNEMNTLAYMSILVKN